MKIKAILKSLFAITVWGASFVATKIALQYVSPVTVVWMRFAMGVAVLGLAVWLSGGFALPQGRDWAYFALLGFLGITFHQWLQSTGLVTSQATTTGWIIASTPIFMALLGTFVLGESLAWHQIAGILLAAVGVGVVVSQGDLAAVLTGSFGAPGDILVLVSAINWAVFSALSRPGLKRHSSTLMMFYVMGFGWLFSSALFLAEGGIREIPDIPVDGWTAILFLGFFCSGVAYIFWYDALKVLSVAQTGAFLNLEPIVTVIVAAMILREPILAGTLIGGMTILLGVWLVNRSAWQAAVSEEPA